MYSMVSVVCVCVYSYSLVVFFFFDNRIKHDCDFTFSKLNKEEVKDEKINKEDENLIEEGLLH